jgi:glycosyltransferase involved in cell wall biosynthesis
MHRWAVKHVVRRIVSISEATASDLRRHWQIAADKIDVVSLGCEFNSIAAPPESERMLEGPRTSSPVLLSPFNLEPRKNLDALLEATALLCSSHPDVQLILFGHAAVTPEREQRFEFKLKALGIEQNVIRTGVVTDGELAKLYREVNLFIFPSLYEGFGLPLLEAMSMGACVIAHDASAMKEVVGEAGVVLEMRDPAGWH